MTRNMKSFNDKETYPTWNEDDEKGASIKGVVTEKREISTEKGEFPLMVIDKGGGEMEAVWCSRKILKDFFSFVREGVYVEIEYLGKEKTKQGRDFHAYKLDYDKDTIKDVEGIDIFDDIKE